MTLNDKHTLMIYILLNSLVEKFYIKIKINLRAYHRLQLINCCLHVE